MANIRTPKNWPAEVTYLANPRIPVPSLGSILHTNSPGSFPVIKTSPGPGPSSLVKITPITDLDHPASGQCGLFATRPLPPNSFILFYLGLVHDSSTTDGESNYDLSLDGELDVSIDATRFGNEARFINDYRGIRSEANAEFRDCVVEVPGRRGLWERRIGVFVLTQGRNGRGCRAQGIKKGEEVVVSYGKGFWTARKHCADLESS